MPRTSMDPSAGGALSKADIEGLLTMASPSTLKPLNPKP